MGALGLPLTMLLRYGLGSIVVVLSSSRFCHLFPRCLQDAVMCKVCLHAYTQQQQVLPLAIQLVVGCCHVQLLASALEGVQIRNAMQET